MSAPSGSDRPSPPLIVIGGGIGGLSTALALARRSIRSIVLEKEPEFVELGAGLQLGPNATRVLDALGVFSTIEPLAVFPRRLILGDVQSGADLFTLDLGEGFVSRFGHRYLVMHRHDLLSTLLAACQEAGVELRPGHEVTSLDDSGHDVVARCADGSEFRGAGAIAADGLWSPTRETIVGDELLEEPYVAYRGTVPREQGSPLARSDAMVMWVGPGTHFVQYALRAGAIFNQVAVFRSERQRSGDPEWGDPTELEAAFADTCPAVTEGLKAIKRDRRWPMVHRPPATTWTRGRVTLLGDAAHAMLQYAAQGACQAIEDAFVLAHAMHDADGNVAEAFGIYERLRLPRASFVQLAARYWGKACHLDGAGRAVRNALLARASTEPYDDVEWLYGYDATLPTSELLGRPDPAWAGGRVSYSSDPIEVRP